MPGGRANYAAVDKVDASGGHPRADGLRFLWRDGVALAVQTAEAGFDHRISHRFGGMGRADAEDDLTSGAKLGQRFDRSQVVFGSALLGGGAAPGGCPDYVVPGRARRRRD